MLWRPMGGEQIGQAMQNIAGFEPPRCVYRQTAARIFVDDGQHAERPAILGAILHEIIGPDVAGAFWPKPDAEPSFSQSRPRLGCFCGTFSPSRRQIQ